VVDETKTVVDGAAISDELLAQCRLSRAQFELYNAASFKFGGIPEVAPPEMVA